MRETDMELQAIRQKLESLKAGPPPAEAMALPWSPPNDSLYSAQSFTPDIEPRPNQPFTDDGGLPGFPNVSNVTGRETSTSTGSPNLSQVAAAIETLKQRSNPPQMPSVPRHPQPNAANPQLTTTQELISHEVQRFETQISKVNALAQEQAQAILGLKDLAVNLEQALKIYGIDSHPDLDAIATFFADYDAVSVTTIGCDLNGYYNLDYETVDFYQAERDAASTAQSLRQRTHSNYRYPASDAGGFLEECFAFCRDLWKTITHALNQQFSGKRPQPNKAHAPTKRNPLTRQLSFLDAAIWFSGAALARVLIHTVLNLYPILWTPLLVGFITLVAIALYQTFLTKRPNVGLSYRLVIMLAGLFVGGQFL